MIELSRSVNQLSKGPLVAAFRELQTQYTAIVGTDADSSSGDEETPEVIKTNVPTKPFSRDARPLARSNSTAGWTRADPSSTTAQKNLLARKASAEVDGPRRVATDDARKFSLDSSVRPGEVDGLSDTVGA